jgi:hypothetical protein
MDVKLVSELISEMDEHYTNSIVSMMAGVERFIRGFIHLFFQRRFVVHRLFGLAYLIQFAYITVLFMADYPAFLASNVIITFPITGVLQSLSATYYFTFLPKKGRNPGYFSDKSVMSYNLVKENIFFATLLCFQWLYYNDRVHAIYVTMPTSMRWVFDALERSFVFLPYMIWRPLVPKTSFRDAIESTADPRKTSQGNENFYYYGTHVTKIFYMWAKHYIGFFLNYLQYMNLVDDRIRYLVYMTLIPSAFATTIALFLHTLRFKGYTSGVVSFSVYIVSYMATFYSYVQLMYVFKTYWLLTLYTFIGMVINRLSLFNWHVYQISLMTIIDVTTAMK